jgi:hypothetical protein
MLRWKRVILTQERPARSNVHQMVMSTLNATHKSQITEPLDRGGEAGTDCNYSSIFLLYELYLLAA